MVEDCNSLYVTVNPAGHLNQGLQSWLLEARLATPCRSLVARGAWLLSGARSQSCTEIDCIT